MSRFGHKKRTVHKELSVCGRGMRTCLANARQNLGVRKALPCSAKGFFESFYNFTKRKKNTARVFFFFWQRYKDSNLK